MLHTQTNALWHLLLSWGSEDGEGESPEIASWNGSSWQQDPSRGTTSGANTSPCEGPGDGILQMQTLPSASLHSWEDEGFGFAVS
jgi:hypothetical protein